MSKIIIDPVSRISGLLEIEVDIENNFIVNAKSSGMQFRGFEKAFQERPPLDMVGLTSRVCGICSTFHALVSSKALEQALQVEADPNGELIRQLTSGFEFLQSHIRHIYQMVIPDYVDLGDISPLQKHISPKAKDFRLPKKINDKIAHHYMDSIKYSRDAHRALAVLAGKIPHPHGVFVGGTTTNMDIKKYQEVKSILYNIKTFIENSSIEDIYIISKYYNEYFKIGKGYGDLMCSSLFYNKNMPLKYVKGGVIIDNKKEEFNIENIVEEYKYTKLEAPNDITLLNDNPPEIATNKEEAYSWIAAPRYKDKPVEVGPLARMIVGGYYNHGISTMDRIIARVLEIKIICECMEGMLEVIRLQRAFQQRYKVPPTGSGIGIVEASRGTLIHILQIENSLTKNYNIITPSQWNLSPRDNNNLNGVLEQALIGTYIENEQLAPTIIGRIVRSFDPCSNCASHITTSNKSRISINIV